jgi:putative ABC transport system permease protein
VRIVVWRTLALAVVGVAMAAAGGLAVTRTLQGQLFGVTTTDPATYGTVILVVVMAALLAAAVPAWRATRVDPAVTLRAE